MQANSIDCLAEAMRILLEGFEDGSPDSGGHLKVQTREGQTLGSSRDEGGTCSVFSSAQLLRSSGS